jgi:hypothetical protein
VRRSGIYPVSLVGDDGTDIISDVSPCLPLRLGAGCFGSEVGDDALRHRRGIVCLAVG